ncbi:hypothetical protein EYF80_065208 [Liparis tanakae]|uniref:Uncharacterized protein n=1 Tax=Liparis tanakae TaxID=230148 RepID=A0A4Z2E6W4_9TELE|nr:hypothetical protein EYF80_065208 [Liparis tanakae]
MVSVCLDRFTMCTGLSPRRARCASTSTVTPPSMPLFKGRSASSSLRTHRNLPTTQRRRKDGGLKRRAAAGGSRTLNARRETSDGRSKVTARMRPQSQEEY